MEEVRTWPYFFASAAHQGKAWRGPHLLGVLTEARRRPPESLSEREEELLQLVDALAVARLLG